MNLLLWHDADARVGDQLRVDLKRYSARPELWPPEPGRCLRFGVLNGAMGKAQVIARDDQFATLRIESLDQPPPAASPITLVLALPRPKMLRRILRSCAELGIKQLHLVNSYRVEKSYWKSPLLQPQQLQGYLATGLEQACDTIMPTVQLWPRFKPFVEDHLPTIAQDSNCLVAHPAAATELSAASNQAITLAIGPEGGFIDYEISMLKAAGFQAVTLGQRILRVETAVPVLISRLSQ